MIKHTLSALALLSLLAACGGAQRTPLAPAAQALWDRCEPALTSYCHEHAHGSPPHEAHCMREEREAMSRMPDEATQAVHMRQRGCAL